jgi:hypothetical protein
MVISWAGLAGVLCEVFAVGEGRANVRLLKTNGTLHPVAVPERPRVQRLGSAASPVVEPSLAASKQRDQAAGEPGAGRPWIQSFVGSQ